MKKFAPKAAPRGARAAAPARKSFTRDGAAPRKPFVRDGAPPRKAGFRDAPPRKPYGGEAPPPRPRKSYGDDAPPRPRKSYGDDAPPRPRRAPIESLGDPYQRAARPPRFARSERGEAGEGERPRGFVVTLDPDVARVFRGEASVNKALRLVMQLMQVVEGPGARADRNPRAPRPGYQGTPEARGFERKPRFVEDSDDSEDGEDVEGEE